MSETALLMVTSGFISVVVLMFVFWLIHLALRNAGVVDIGWALGLMLITAIYCWLGPGFWDRRAAALGMVTLWALRMAGLLTLRVIRDSSEDRRYQKLRKDWGGNTNLKFLSFFEMQAILNMILSLPFLWAALNPHPHLRLVEIMGCLIWGIGFAGESLADEQLRRFRVDPVNKGQVCERGLWFYSRHPNYFFEWLMWVGYFVFALGSPWGWTSVICPALMLFLLLKVTGVPLAEEMSLNSRGDLYRRYQRTTSIFIPLPRRKEKGSHE